MPRLPLPLLLLALLAALAAPAAAQRAYPASTPEEAAQSLGEAARTGDWEGLAGLMHPAALAEMRELFMTPLARPDAAQLLPMIFGVETPEDAANLTDPQLFAALMRTMTGQAEELAEIMKTSETVVLGTVREGPDTVHVVQRVGMKFGDFPMKSVVVTTVVRDGAAWRGILTAEISGIAAGLRQMLEQEE